MSVGNSNSFILGCFYFLVSAAITYALLSFAWEKLPAIEEQEEARQELIKLEDRIYALLVEQDKAYLSKYQYFKEKENAVNRIKSKADNLFAAIPSGEPIAKKWSNEADWEPIGINKTVEVLRYEYHLKMDSLLREKRAFVAERGLSQAPSKDLSILYELRQKKLRNIDALQLSIDEYNRSTKKIMQNIAGVLGVILLVISAGLAIQTVFT